MSEFPKNRPLRILIADSTRMGCQLLAEALERHGLEVLASTSNSREFLAIAMDQKIDVAIVGSTVDEEPGRGFDLLKAFRSSHPSTPVVMLLESSQRTAVIDAFRAGARGIFCKQELLDGLRKCVECVHAGQVWANREQLSFALDALASTPSVHGIDTKALSVLSKREHQVVQCLAEGLTNREIGQRLKLSSHTVKNYLFRIFDKVGVSSRVELLFLSLSHPVSPSILPAHTEESAFEACRVAAKTGSPSAQLLLARFYFEGRGVTKDVVRAYKWTLIAEASTREIGEQAQVAKAIGASSLTSEEMREAHRRADEWLRKAASEREILGPKIAPTGAGFPKAASA